MAKVYTAQEMRKRAELVEQGFLDFPTGAMLRQAADLMEREEKREKKYEYSEKYSDGQISPFHEDIDNVVILLAGSTKVRREVGEWEEVKDGE